jgi:hypothetical protein
MLLKIRGVRNSSAYMVKVRPVKIFLLYRFKKKIDICIKIKLFLHTFQIYNHLLTEIIIKRIIWHHSFNNNFCQKIIIYLEILYNKLYFDIKFISEYWKMNSKSWQDGLFHGTKWRENDQCSRVNILNSSFNISK